MLFSVGVRRSNVSEEELEALREGGMAKSAADFHTSQVRQNAT